MLIRMICLSNSWREHGRCVAGICQGTREWVRPVPAGGGPIGDRDTIIDGRYLAPLDVVRLRVLPMKNIIRFQRENREIVDRNWTMVGRIRVREVKQYCNQSREVLHSREKFVEPPTMEGMSPDQWESLRLVRVSNVTFARHERKTNRWIANFSLHRRGPEYRLNVTDPIATTRLDKGGRIRQDCLLTISLTEPVAFPRWGIPERCYKVVTAVMELG